MAAERSQAFTKRCGRQDHQELVATFDDLRTRYQDVRALLDSFEQAVGAGSRFADGDLVRVGGGLLRLVERDHVLILTEPDFQAPELQFVVGVDATIAHLRAQEAVAVTLGVSPRFPALDQRAHVCSHLDGQGFILDRSAPTHVDSGIRIGCGEESEGIDAHPIVELTLHEVVCHYPAAAPFLALPPGATAAVISGGDAVLLHAGIERQFSTERLSEPIMSGVRPLPLLARSLR